MQRPGAQREDRPASTGLMGEVNDGEITTKLNAQLARDERLGAMDIDVDTERGIVTLAGSAASAAAKERAGDIARGIEGVREVRNELQVSDRTAGSDAPTAPDTSAMGATGSSPAKEGGAHQR